jgi:hypothetical protein
MKTLRMILEELYNRAIIGCPPKDLRDKDRDIIQAIAEIQELISKDFEDFLRDKHAEQYKGCDDNMVDDYEDWLTKLDYEAYIKYANACIAELKERLV